MSKRIEIAFGNINKAFRFSQTSSLEEQLRSSFRIPSISQFEMIDGSGAIVPFSDLEDGATYILNKITLSDWTSRPLWQTKDPIHGLIHLPDTCLRFIDTPEFQRLRDLKQTGSCYLVYIGTHHTRFDHSVGVGWLGFRMVSSIAERQPELKINSRDILCVTLAALCHDLGHGPGSHSWDAILKNQGIDMPHEEMSLLMIDRIVANAREKWRVMQRFDDPFDGLTDDDFKFIKAMIHPPKGEYTLESVGRDKDKLFLMDIVSNKSNGIDVDRCDYIQRDTFHSGVRGVFDVDRLIRNVVVRDVDGKLAMCWPQKDLEGIIEIFHTRDSLHRRVYQHRTNVSIESMFRDAIILASPCIQVKNEEGQWVSFKESQQNVGTFVKFSDWIFHFIMHGDSVKIDWEDPRVAQAKTLLKDVEYRKIWKFVGTIMCNVSDHEKAKLELERCSGNFIPAEQWELKTAMFSWGHGDRNPLENVPFIRKNHEEPMKPKPEDLSRVFIPAAFKEHALYVYVKSQDEDVRALAQDAFTQWCSERGIESSLVDMSSVTLSKRTRKRPTQLGDRSPHTPAAKKASPSRRMLQRHGSKDSTTSSRCSPRRKKQQE
jgi:HD superfamily phosphohydrolase